MSTRAKPSRERRRDRDAAAGRRVLDGVREQVRDDLSDAAAVADQLERRARGLEDESMNPGLGREQLDLLRQELAQLERLEREREAPGVHLLHVEEIVDQAREAARLAVHGREIALARHLVEVALQEQLDEAEDAGERRAQLVRDGRDELGLDPCSGAFGGDLADHDHAADEIAGGVAHRPGVPLERAADSAQLELVLGRAVGVVRDRLHRGEVRGRVDEAVGDRRTLIQGGGLGNAEQLNGKALDDRVGEQRTALQVDQADAVDAGVEQGAVDVHAPLEQLGGRGDPPHRPHDRAGEVDGERHDQEHRAREAGDARRERNRSRRVRTGLGIVGDGRRGGDVARGTVRATRRRGAGLRRRRPSIARRPGRRAPSRPAARRSRGCTSATSRRWRGRRAPPAASRPGAPRMPPPGRGKRRGSASRDPGTAPAA